MNSKEYLEASEKTASSEWHKEIVSTDLLFSVLTKASLMARDVDAVKKSLFYGKPLTEETKQSAMIAETSRWNPDNVDHDILHAALGLFTEAAEMLECVTLGMFRKLDDVNMVEEAGDAEWYLAMLYRALNKTPEEVKALNIKKLQARYPEKFDSEKANNRDLEAEREVLEGHK